MQGQRARRIRPSMFFLEVAVILSLTLIWLSPILHAEWHEVGRGPLGELVLGSGARHVRPAPPASLGLNAVPIAVQVGAMVALGLTIGGLLRDSGRGWMSVFGTCALSFVSLQGLLRLLFEHRVGFVYSLGSGFFTDDGALTFSVLGSISLTATLACSMATAFLDTRAVGLFPVVFLRYLPRVVVFHSAALLFFTFVSVPLWNYCLRFLLAASYATDTEHYVGLYARLAGLTHTLTFCFGVTVCAAVNAAAGYIGNSTVVIGAKLQPWIFRTAALGFTFAAFLGMLTVWVAIALVIRVPHVVEAASAFFGDEAVAPVYITMLTTYGSCLGVGIVFEQRWEGSASNTGQAETLFSRSFRRKVRQSDAAKRQVRLKELQDEMRSLESDLAPTESPKGTDVVIGTDQFGGVVFACASAIVTVVLPSFVSSGWVDAWLCVSILSCLGVLYRDDVVGPLVGMRKQVGSAIKSAALHQVRAFQTTSKRRQRSLSRASTDESDSSDGEDAPSADPSALLALAAKHDAENRGLSAYRLLRRAARAGAADGPIRDRYLQAVKEHAGLVDADGEAVRKGKAARRLQRYLRDDGDGWRVMRDSDGVRSLYKREEDRWHVVRVEGTVQCPAFVMLSLMREVDLLPDWVPHPGGIGLTEAFVLGAPSSFHVDAALSISLPWPLAKRAVVMRADGIDCMQESRKQVMLLMESAELSAPEVGNAVRLNLGAGSGFVFTPEAGSPGTTRVQMLLRLDHMPGVPGKVIEFSFGGVAPLLISMMQAAGQQALEEGSKWRRRYCNAASPFYPVLRAKIADSLPEESASVPAVDADERPLEGADAVLVSSAS